MRQDYDAVVIGSGPNGLGAAITLAREGLAVLVREAADSIGGGARTAELTLPGFHHDICSAVHPMAVASPLFCALPLAEHGLEWIHPPAALAHPLDDGTAVILEQSIEGTGKTLGSDAEAYRRLMEPLVEDWPRLSAMLLGPMRPLAGVRHPGATSRFGLLALRSARSLAQGHFRGERARALFAGLAGHSVLPLEALGSAAVALVLGMVAHTLGWPFPRGGSQRISDALASYFQFLGGGIVTGAPVNILDDVPPARAVLCDVTPRQLLRIAGDRLPSRFRRQLARYRYGPGAYKVDWALAGPIPWRAKECARAATVHLGGTLDEIAQSERAAWQGDHPERPYVLLVQPSLFDPTRAPAGRHTAWAYCHVPHGSGFAVADRIEWQVERFAPGFRDLILGRSVLDPAGLECHNANLVGGDITGGAQNLGQLFLRPTRRLYRTPLGGLYLCSASTPPGGGVHGMCGYHAARAGLGDLFGR